MDENFDHPAPGPSGGPSLPVGATDTHEGMTSPAYRQGREALRISRQVRKNLAERE